METSSVVWGHDRHRRSQTREEALGEIIADLQEAKPSLKRPSASAMLGTGNWDTLTDRVNWSDETLSYLWTAFSGTSYGLATVRRKDPPASGGVFRALEEALSVVPVTTQNVACSGRREKCVSSIAKVILKGTLRADPP